LNRGVNTQRCIIPERGKTRKAKLLNPTTVTKTLLSENLTVREYFERSITTVLADLPAISLHQRREPEIVQNLLLIVANLELGLPFPAQLLPRGQCAQ
jgi:hypothetical protein